MTRPKPNHIPEPRVLNDFQVACRLGWSVETFRTKRETLREKGFPQPDDFFGGYDSVAVEDWLDRHYGRKKPVLGENPWDGALNGESQNAVR